MSIATSATSTTLTGADAKKFNNQVKFGRPSAAAQESYVRGSKLLKALAKTGSAKVKAK